MQFSVYEIMDRVRRMTDIRELIEGGKPIDDHMNYIYDMLMEYSDILQSAKVKI